MRSNGRKRPFSLENFTDVANELETVVGRLTESDDE